MKLGWRFHQILILVALGAILILTSGLLELANVARLAAEDAAMETRLITKTLLSQMERAVQESRGDPFRTLQGDRSIRTVVAAALASSPSVVYVAICDSAGIAIVHTTPEAVGRRLDLNPPLPEPRSFRSSFLLLTQLRRSPPFYEASSPFRLRGVPATIRVGVAGGLVRERVGAVFRRAVWVALVELALAMAVGFGLANVTRGRLRRLEEGVAAWREGRLGTRIPESGVDEFSRLARDLNLLSEQFERERQGQDFSLRQAVDLLGDGILTLGPDRKVVLVNHRAEHILGLRMPSVGLNLEEVLPEDHPVRRLAERLYVQGAHTLSVALPGNGSQTAHVAVGHQISGNNSPGGVLIEIKKTESLQEIHSLVDHSRVLSRLGQMAAGVAHEIRNPLQTINLELATLRGAKDLGTEEITEHVRTAQDEIQRLQRAVSGFLRVARLQRMSLVSVDLNELLTEVHRSNEAEASLSGLELELVLDSDLPEITADPEVVRQALQNLVRNAIQAQPSREGKVVLKGSCTEGEVRLSVKDTGPGIPEENLERVFDLYFTTKEGGSGVGLALVRQAVEMHNGTVELRTQRGNGTEVLLRIPVLSVMGEV